MGLPGAGKTTLANELYKRFLDDNRPVVWFNGDHVRLTNNDWDFSEEGRLRQAKRMKELTDLNFGRYVICDFGAPLKKMRDIFKPDYIIFVDTIQESVYNDTNEIFQRPKKCDFHIIKKDAENMSRFIYDSLRIEWHVEKLLEENQKQ